MSKYRAKKITVDGMTFDSKKELMRWQQLKSLERVGMISDLRRQEKYDLLPEQRGESPGVYTKGKCKGLCKPGKLLERGVNYVADFVYTRNGETVVEDTKGFKTKDYIIKRKMMLYFHGIRISEV